MEDEDEEDEVEVEDEDEEDEVEDEVAAGYTWTLTSHPPLLATWLLSCTLRVRLVGRWRWRRSLHTSRTLGLSWR
jgi:hypothetical protein